jgi:hypothetical protein
VPTLLDMGIACMLFDTPLAGERSLARNHRGDIVSELVPLLEKGIRPRAALVPLLMQAVAQDFATVLELVEQRHGLRDPVAPCSASAWAPCWPGSPSRGTASARGCSARRGTPTCAGSPAATRRP